MYLCQSMRLSKQWFLNFCGSSSPKYLMKAITFSSERLIQSPHFEGSVCCRLEGCSALGEQAVLDCEQPEVTGPQVLPSSHFGGCYWAQMFLFLPNVGTKVIFFSADFNLIFFFFQRKCPKEPCVLELIPGSLILPNWGEGQSRTVLCNQLCQHQQQHDYRNQHQTLPIECANLLKRFQ